MNNWAAWGTIAAGAVLLGFYLFEVFGPPYTIFAVLVGTGWLVDGVRRLCHLRRPQKLQNSEDLPG
ncbi:hypothetical protein [Streptomyces sp. NPDC015242]|uniref:hypothetical protein n=1 Tax=Streptomyces sp. NPDC015242 TaxID=3364951 RepID=UPI0036FC46D5